MSETIFYEYNTTPDTSDPSGLSFNVSPLGIQPEGLIVTATYNLGDPFVFNNQEYTFAGGADSGGKQVGFFAVDSSGAVHFFATTPVTAGEAVTLNTAESETICFMAGTHIAVPGGARAIEELAIGDRVLTADGRTAPVKWIGRQTLSATFADPLRALPIRIKANALDDNLPARDLLISPCHAVLVDGVLVQAGALVNGSSIVRETDVPESFVYYHIELEDHALVLAEGVAAETFVDNVGRMAFDNWDEHERLYPQARAMAELPYARAASVRQVPAVILRKLEARAGLGTRAAA